MLAYQDLFQRPYFHRAPSMSIAPGLAAEIASLVRQQEFPFYHYDALMLEAPGDFGPGLQESGRNYGSGASFANPAEALVKSVFEAWERKSSKVFDDVALVSGTYRELADRAVSPEAFALVSDWEYQQSPLSYVRYSPDLPLSWKECYRVGDRALEPVLIPATLVYSRFSWKYPRERFAPNLSPGLACHFTYRSAFLNGLCELIERDAFMLTWLHRRRPPRIRPETVAFADAQPAVQYLQAAGFLVHFLDLTTDLQVPVVLTLVEHPHLAWEGTLVPGLGCDPDPQAALRKSLLEALVMLSNHVTFDHARERLVLVPQTLPYGLRRDMYYRNVRFLLEGSQWRAIQELPNSDRQDSGRNLDNLLRTLSARGHPTYFVDLTPPGYEHCRLCLIRAFIAGLQPMLYEPDCWRLNPQRLFGTNPPAFERLNVMPHPFMLHT